MIFVGLYICVLAQMHESMYVCMYVCMHVGMYVSVYMCMCVCVYMCVCECVGVCVCRSKVDDSVFFDGSPVYWDCEWSSLLPRPRNRNSHPHTYKASALPNGTQWFCTSPIGDILGLSLIHI